jgi:hypothetical protein
LNSLRRASTSAVTEICTIPFTTFPLSFCLYLAFHF